jgi:inorganic pyrophosphatase/exopolyphosphatase
MNDMIFQRYGMNGTRAEAELQTMFVLKFLGKEVLDLEETMGLQQVQKKWLITHNEMLRHFSEKPSLYCSWLDFPHTLQISQ